MAARKTLNARRLTKSQVTTLISSGARPRQDLSAAFEQAFGAEYRAQTLVYELDGDRYLFVFGGAFFPGLTGKGDIYSADSLQRLVRWSHKVEEDSAHGRGSSVRHWAYYSQLKHELIPDVGALVEQLRSAMSRTPEELDLSYRSLDLVSQLVEEIGVERAQAELYDQLVAYV